MNRIYKYFGINLGLIIMSIGIYFFLIPSKLAVGGITGLAMIIQNAIPFINIGILMIFFNIILFILAYFFIGREFSNNSIYSSFALSGLIWFLEIYFPITKPLAKDLILNLSLGIIFQGVGMAIIFYYNASTGGTDIVAKIINKFTDIPIGRALLLSDFLIVLFAGLSFGIEYGMYAFLGIIINGSIIDEVISDFNNKINLLIISKKSKEINEYINDKLERGTRILNGVEGYSSKENEVIISIVSKNEYDKLKKFIKKVDNKAFLVRDYENEFIDDGFELDLKCS